MRSPCYEHRLRPPPPPCRPPPCPPPSSRPPPCPPPPCPPPPCRPRPWPPPPSNPCFERHGRTHASALYSGAQHGASSQEIKHARGHAGRVAAFGGAAVRGGRPARPTSAATDGHRAAAPPPTPGAPTTALRTRTATKQELGSTCVVEALSIGSKFLRGELPLKPHGDPPPFVRHRQAIAVPRMLTTARARMCPRRRAAALAARSRSLALLWRRAYLGSVRRATTSFLPNCRARSRAVLPSVSRSDGSAPFWRRRLTIARWPSA